MFQSESGDIFDKGHGIRLLVQHTKCDLTHGSILVCGDSMTDLPMLQACLRENASGVFTVWVTRNEELKQTVSTSCSTSGEIYSFQVRHLCKRFNNNNVVFVSCPEVLLAAMAQGTIRENSINRPHVAQDYDV